MADVREHIEELSPPVRRLRELAMSAAWNGALQRDVVTTSGDAVHVVYHGNWSNGYGPDFAGAMLELEDGKLVTGGVEIHLRASDWINHGHHLDPAYNDVVLHIVGLNDTNETRCSNGKTVPVAVLTVPDETLFAIDQRLPQVWHELGGSVCAADLTQHHPDVIRAALHRLGDVRFRAKAAQYESGMLEHGPDAVFLRALFGAFGYSANRSPMEHLAELVLRYGVLTNTRAFGEERPNPWLVGVLLGMGGFLPLAPPDAHAAGILPEDQYRIELAWQSSGAGFAHEFVPARSWQVARVRPANHPAYRIMQLATLVAQTDGGALCSLRSAVAAGQDVVELLRETTARPGHPGLGAGRATAITASVVLPCLAAIASIEADHDLEDCVARAWADLRHAEWTQPAKRALRQVTGGPTLRRLGERGHQGLLHLDRELCAPRKCSACPIAAAVVNDRNSLVSQVDPPPQT